VERWERRYRCRRCAAVHAPDAVRWRCDCHGLLDVEGGAVSFPPDVVSRPPSLWRWAEALPFAPTGDAARIGMGEGATPVVPIIVAHRELVATVEFASPTLSFKDRGAAVLVAKASELGARRLVADSSGNAGTAIAAYAARAGLPCAVHVAASTPPAKLAQMAVHGADVRLVDGTREEVAAAAIDAVERGEGFYASHVWNPFFFEGTKTWAFDVWLALGGVPDVCVLPVGNGTLVLGAARGFEELRSAGLTAAIPRLVAVQTAACAPIARAFRANATAVEPVRNEGTVAEGIAIGAPARGDQVLDVVRASGGTVLTVEDDATMRARTLLAEQGLFVEPTAAATVAGAAVWLAAADDPAGTVVVPLCGSGLKAP
jgi:threonine synthase